jgi:hypothetical protein
MTSRPPLVAVALAAIALAVPSAAHAAKGVSCSAKSVTYLMWPHGHPQIPSVGFPDIATPHMEIYRSGAGYPGANFLGYADANGSTDFSRNCATVKAKKPTKIAHVKRLRKQKAVVCAFPKNVVFDVGLTPKGPRIRTRMGSKTVAQADVRSTGTVLTYNSKYCKAHASPH